MKVLGALLTFFLLGGLAEAQDAVEYYHLDGLGSVRAVSDQAGALIERHDYFPFGEECVAGPCAGSPGAGGGQARKFTGKERDSETGLDYFGARYSASRTGRFTSVDPALEQTAAIVHPQLWNRYVYGLNNPLRYVDPDGRQAAPGQYYVIGQGWVTRSVLDPANQATPAMAKQFMVVTAGIGLLAGGIGLVPSLLAEGQIFTGSCLASAGCQNVVRGLAEGASGAPPGAMGTIPTLTAAGNRAMFQQAVDFVTGSKGSAADKVRMFEGLAAQMTELSGGSWTATRGTASNAAGVWVGEGRPFGLAIDGAGSVWTTANIHEGATFGATGITIDYSKWTLR